MDLMMGTTEALFLSDKEYQVRRNSLMEFYSILDPATQGCLNRNLLINDLIRKEYRSDPELLERIRKRLEADAGKRRAASKRKELLTMFSIYKVLHDSDEDYAREKDVIISEYFVSDPEEKAMLQRILDGLDELREAFRNDDRMKEILAKLKPEEEE